MTGGVVPEGADTVVMQERAQASGKSITFAPGQKTGQNVREAGEDLEGGSVALAGRASCARGAGAHRLARDRRGRGLPAAARRLLLHRRRAEGVGTTLGEGEIYDSNRYTLTACSRASAASARHGRGARRSRRRSSARSPKPAAMPTS
jgi:molybdopterin molybdotransferase